MATPKNKTTTEVAEPAAEPTQALAKVSTAAAHMAIASDAKAGDKRGTENIDEDDVRIPFLAIAQLTSKAIDPSEVGKYIDGLKFGQIYNSETKEILPAKTQFIPILMRKRAALILEGGKLGQVVPWDDPRVTWEGAKEANLEKPEGQRIYDWAVLVLPTMEMAVISFRSTSFGTGKSLNNFVRMRKPAFAGVYELSVFLDKNEDGKFGRFVVTPAGAPTPEQFAFAEFAFSRVSTQGIKTSEDAGGADAPQVSDETADGPDRGAAPAVDGQVVEKKDVPF